MLDVKALSRGELEEAALRLAAQLRALLEAEDAWRGAGLRELADFDFERDRAAGLLLELSRGWKRAG